MQWVDFRECWQEHNLYLGNYFVNAFCYVFLCICHVKPMCVDIRVHVKDFILWEWVYLCLVWDVNVLSNTHHLRPCCQQDDFGCCIRTYHGRRPCKSQPRRDEGALKRWSLKCSSFWLVDANLHLANSSCSVWVVFSSLWMLHRKRYFCLLILSWVS